ncbi:exosome complex component RRP41 [Neocloeon triangulifer]|uniref:exosome complex component RRP41 n=1 Tax=Neocloeon triangulifer TaxID=2078957 RepID=UPI00286F6455|nr:exosome complex component RRP41 [Neocloeon triangulifer]XP_059485012.1 exosome complex component RRP41 [Neocloeon triangulifer]
MAGLQLLSEYGLRVDGRRPNELRQIRCKLGVFDQPDGSAYLEQGNTKVLAAVYGPHEIRGNKSKTLHDRAYVNCQYSMAVFSTAERKRRPRGDKKSQEMDMNLQQIFETAIRSELYPRSQIDIYLEVLQADGGNLSACVNAGTLALIDAGIPLKDYVCSCTSTLAPSQGGAPPTPMVDVNHLEETLGGPGLSVSTMTRLDSVVHLELSGTRLHLSHIDPVASKATTGCADIQAILDKAVRGHVAQSLMAREASGLGADT